MGVDGGTELIGEPGMEPRQTQARKLYCIRADYMVTNSRKRSHGQGYWHSRRTKLSAHYQWAVYKEASRLIRSSRGSVLDIGCGPAKKLARLLVPYARRVVGVDRAEAIACARVECPGGEFFELDLERDEWSLKEVFDLVISVDVIEHLDDPDRLMAAVRTAAGSSGLALLSTPDRDRIRGRDCRAAPNGEHVREWNREEFAQYVNSQGFSILRHWHVPALRPVSSIEWLRQSWAQLRAFRSLKSCQVVLCKPE